MGEPQNKRSLGDILTTCQIITSDDIAAALEEQRQSGCRFGEALVKLGIVTQEDIDWALSSQLDIPYIRLKAAMLDPAALRLVPAELARRYNLIPLICAGSELSIAIADPLNKAAIEAIEHHTGCTVNISVALIREVREMIDAAYGSVSGQMLGFTSAAFSEQALAAINADLGGGKLLDYLMVLIIQNRLSSLSLQPCGDTIAVTGRRGGVTRPVGQLKPDHYPDVTQRLRMAAAMGQIHDISASGILNFSYRSRTVSFRVDIMQGSGGDYVTLRPHIAASIPTRLSGLQLSQGQADAFAGLAQQKRGVTFFASRSTQERDRFIDLMLEEADTGGTTVIILGEGPGRLAKRFPRVTLPADEASRARIIMDSLEHVPDLLVIETVTEALPFIAACRAAMQGVRVLAGLEVRDTHNLLQLLLSYQRKNLFLPVFVNGLVSVRGIHLLCPSCRERYLPPAEELAALRFEQPPESFYRSAGCDACGHTGTHSRRFLMDIIPFDDAFLEVFEQAGDVEAVTAYLERSGYRGSEQEGRELLTSGQVSPEEYISSIIL